MAGHPLLWIIRAIYCSKIRNNKYQSRLLSVSVHEFSSITPYFQTLVYFDHPRIIWYHTRSSKKYWTIFKNVARRHIHLFLEEQYGNCQVIPTGYITISIMGTLTIRGRDMSRILRKTNVIEDGFKLLQIIIVAILSLYLDYTFGIVHRPQYSDTKC